MAVAGDYFYLRYLESDLTTAVAACEAESNRLVEASAKSQTQTKEKPNSADDYAAWIVKNKDKRGTEEFEFVARAYQEAKAEEERKIVPASDLTPEQLQAIENAKARMAKAQGKKTYTIDEVMTYAPVPSGENGPRNNPGPYDDILYGYVCEPFDLATAGYDLESISKVQQKVVAAYRSKASFDATTFGAVSVFALLLLGILPHTWYFLLRRLREVAASIRGE